VDRSKGYNRAARKLLHIAGGSFALAVPFVPYLFGLAAAIGATILAYLLRPKHAWWLRYISKPIDRKRNVITGLRGYATVILLLVLLWPLLERIGIEDAKRYVMFGWLALAFGDGLAGLVGPGPTIARTVPWNRHKTWWGLMGCFAGVLAAHIISFGLPFPGLAPLPLAVQFESAGAIAAIVALLESLDLQADDNYTVGLGAPLLACVTHLLLV
jgi:dolichol kinase